MRQTSSNNAFAAKAIYCFESPFLGYYVLYVLYGAPAAAVHVKRSQSMKISVKPQGQPPQQDRPFPAPSHVVIASDLTSSPLGQVTLLVSILNCRGVEPAVPLRIFKDYA